VQGFLISPNPNWWMAKRILEEMGFYASKIVNKRPRLLQKLKTLFSLHKI